MSGLSDHTQAIVDLLDEAGILADRSRTPVPDDDRTTQPAVGGGWSGAPGQSEFYDYAIVFPRSAEDIVHRDLDGNFDERRPTWDVRTVGGSADQADDLRDDVIDALKASPITVAGFGTVHFKFREGFGAVPDYDVTPTEFYTGTTFELWTQETS